MFSRNTGGLLAAIVLLSSGAAFAEPKFGYVDLQRALMEITEGKQAKARMESMLQAKQKEIDKQQEALKKEQELLAKQASAMSEETRIQKATEFQKKIFDLQQKMEKDRAEMAKTQQATLQSIFGKMDPIIAQIAQREGLTMVFEKTDSGLVYAPPHLDYTNDLIRMYNEKNKGDTKSESKTPANIKKK